jgi:CrcB protein
MMNLNTLIAVASGGAIGATTRLYANDIINRYFGSNFPYGTMAVNLVGSLTIGLLMGYFMHHTHISPYIKTFLITGFLGGLTTYSTFAMESFFMLDSGRYIHALANISANLLGTIILAGAGYIIATNLIK